MSIVKNFFIQQAKAVTPEITVCIEISKEAIAHSEVRHLGKGEGLDETIT